MANPKRTQLSTEHERLGAKMVDFGGWWMPVRFSGTVEEHLRVRRSVGLFDVSHMGEIVISGSDAEKVTNHLVTNNISKLDPGQALYTALCYDHGGIVDDLLVYRMDNEYLLVVNASNIEKDYAWIRDNADGDVEITNQSDDFIQIALQGPEAVRILAPLVNTDISALGFYRFAIAKMANMEVILSRTGYTGEDGFEIYAKGGESEACTLWRDLLTAGKEFDILPVGLGARDTLRMEMGYCLYGNDINEETSPLEAGLGWVTKLKKGPFIGREALLEQKANGLSRKLTGFITEGRSAPRHGYPILSDKGAAGFVTSGAYSPSLETCIGMGYISVDTLQTDSELYVDRRGTPLPVTREKLPFYKEGSHL